MDLPSEEFLTLARQLRRDVAAFDEVSVRLPGQQPCDLPDGLVWLVEMAAEGWYLAYEVEATNSTATVWVKQWEFGQPEPRWDTVRQRPAAAPSPDVGDWQQDTTYQRARDEARRTVMAATAP